MVSSKLQSNGTSSSIDSRLKITSFGVNLILVSTTRSYLMVPLFFYCFMLICLSPAHL
jgi:hypothetical protein